MKGMWSILLRPWMRLLERLRFRGLIEYESVMLDDDNEEMR